MKSRSAKAKGRKFQQEVRDKIREIFPELELDDITCTMMSQAGTDIILSPAARKKFPYSIECKNQEKIAIWDALKQADENKKENTFAVVAFRRNHTKPYVVIEMDHFFDLLMRLINYEKNITLSSFSDNSQV
jgi:hypothetical protein